MRYITLKEIIENIYKTQGQGVPDDIDEAVDNFLHKPNEDSQRGVLYPVKDDELSVGEYSSIRNAGAIKSGSHFPKKPFKKVIANISRSGNAWFKEYVKYLETQIDYPIIRMNESLEKYIDEVINDSTIDMPDNLRAYLRNPYIAYDYGDDNYKHWIRLAWLIILSVVQSDLIKELSSLWILPAEYTLSRNFAENYNIAVYSSSKYAREVLDVQLDEDGTINLSINFMPHMDVETIPEWASLVLWVPHAPLDYSDYSGKLSFDIRGVSGLSKVCLELQNTDNTGGHKYYSPFSVDYNWKTICEDFSKKAISTNILKTFGAICFVIHPDFFTGKDKQAQIQIKNIIIE